MRNETDAAHGALDAVLAIRNRDHHHRAAYESVPYRGAINLLGQTATTQGSFEDLATGIKVALDRLRRSTS